MCKMLTCLKFGMISNHVAAADGVFMQEFLEEINDCVCVVSALCGCQCLLIK